MGSTPALFHLRIRFHWNLDLLSSRLPMPVLNALLVFPQLLFEFVYHNVQRRKKFTCPLGRHKLRRVLRRYVDFDPTASRCSRSTKTRIAVKRSKNRSQLPTFSVIFSCVVCADVPVFSRNADLHPQFSLLLTSMPD